MKKNLLDIPVLLLLGIAVIVLLVIGNNTPIPVRIIVSFLVSALLLLVLVMLLLNQPIHYKKGKNFLWTYNMDTRKLFSREIQEDLHENQTEDIVWLGDGDRLYFVKNIVPGNPSKKIVVKRFDFYSYTLDDNSSNEMLVLCTQKSNVLSNKMIWSIISPIIGVTIFFLVICGIVFCWYTHENPSYSEFYQDCVMVTEISRAEPDLATVCYNASSDEVTAYFQDNCFILVVCEDADGFSFFKCMNLDMAKYNVDIVDLNLFTDWNQGQNLEQYMLPYQDTQDCSAIVRSMETVFHIQFDHYIYLDYETMCALFPDATLKWDSPTLLPNLSAMSEKKAGSLEKFYQSAGLDPVTDAVTTYSYQDYLEKLSQTRQALLSCVEKNASYQNSMENILHSFENQLLYELLDTIGKDAFTTGQKGVLTSVQPGEFKEISTLFHYRKNAYKKSFFRESNQGSIPQFSESVWYIDDADRMHVCVDDGMLDSEIVNWLYYTVKQ